MAAGSRCSHTVFEYCFCYKISNCLLLEQPYRYFKSEKKLTQFHAQKAKTDCISYTTKCIKD
jgi:hypothetical protein